MFGVARETKSPASCGVFFFCETEMPITNQEALEALSFGSVDAESEKDLSDKFLKTNDFKNFTDPNTSLILGPKGSGKSALFELITKYEFTARSWSQNALDNVIFAEATGFRDTSEIDTSTIEELRKNPDFGYPKLWELYFSIKIADKLSKCGIRTKGASSELLKKIGKERDYRILPLAKSLWESLIGRVPKKIKIPIIGEINFGTTLTSVSTNEILEDINSELIKRNKEVWLIFDKIDEIFPMSSSSRIEALSHLMQMSMECRKKYSKIKFKIFLRTDIWNHLKFTNKTHLLDKAIELKWDKQKLQALLVKRALANGPFKIYAEEKIDAKIDTENLLKSTQDAVFYLIFDKQVYNGPNESTSLNWMIERATDSLDGVYPREMIMYGNISRSIQLKTGASIDSLIAGKSIKDSYYEVSKARCDGYLSEFPEYSKHFEKFSGKTSAEFSRAELKAMFKDLKQNTDEAINELATNVGILKPTKNEHAANAEKYQVPRLYRSGLGITTKGRP